MAKEYRRDLDVFKGIAIVAVILYHLGILKSGYLAVDLFLVINGFLIIPSVCRQILDGSFKYGAFLKKRTFRLLPIVLIATIACLIGGAWGMLPDHYENLAQSVVASNLLSGNILSSLTAKNYWSALNDYKPLMHLWYIGVLFEFYVIFPLILMAANRFVFSKPNRTAETNNRALNLILVSLCAISVLCYLNPFTFGINPHTAEGIRFYWIQNRLFELCAGGLVGLNMQRMAWVSRRSWISPIVVLLLFGTICIGLATFDIHAIGSHLPVIGAPVEYGTGLLLPTPVLLLLTVVLSCLAVASNQANHPALKYIFNSRPLAFIGKMSLSLFVWHQVIIAFYRYYYTNELSVLSFAIYMAVVWLVAWTTWYFVEQRLKPSKASWIGLITAGALSTIAAIGIYLHAGVIRDIPELDIHTNDIHRNMHSEYCDRIYGYNHEFTQDSNKTRVLVIGNSFARDWGNILLESSVKDDIELSYIYTNYNLDKLDKTKHLQRIQQSDYIFIFAEKAVIPDYVWENVKNRDHVYGLGTKNFGQNNGSIYRHRNDPDYFAQTVAANPEYDEINARWKSQWGDRYIDFIEKVRTADNRIRVFSPDHKFISQDCEHLTRGGAQFYAKSLDIKRIFGSANK